MIIGDLKIHIGGRSSGSAGPDGVPSGLTLTVISDTEIDLLWIIGSTDQDGHSIERSADNITWSEIATVTGVTATYNNTTGIVANTLYYYRVRAYKGTDYSAYSNTASDITWEVWYLSGGISAANALAAWKPLKAASLAASYVNLANPGTYNAAPGIAPTFDEALGWIFNGTTQYLVTGLVPVTTGQVWSMVIRFSGFVENATIISCLIGEYTASKQFWLGQGAATAKTITWANGGSRVSSNNRDSGYLGFIGNLAYFEIYYINTIAAGTTNPIYDIYLGAMHYTSTVDYAKVNIQCAAVYNTVLTADQLKAVMYGMYIADKVNLAKRFEYINKQFAALICFNMPTFKNSDGPAGDLDPDDFAPTGLDIDNWLDACVSAGISVAYLTVKHHDGFMLWPSAQAAPAHDPYTIARTTWYANNGSPDIVGLFVAGCNARGIKPGLYFSIYDKTHEARTGTDETTDAAAYTAMILAQLTELLSNYGDIYSLWLDGWQWHVLYRYIPPTTIHPTIKALQSDCIIITNDHEHPALHSEIEIYEVQTADGWVAAGNKRLSENVQTTRIDTTWFHNNTLGQLAANFMSATDINTNRLQSISRRSVYNIGLQVDRSGHLPAAQVTLLGQVGAL